jgi:hypothetical protein
MYIEMKTPNDNGPARIGWVKFSKTGLSIYYGGKTFARTHDRGAGWNYYDIDTGEKYWISGVKKNGEDRHWAGGGPVEIDDDARDEYQRLIRKS